MLDPLPSINKVYSLVIQEASNNHSLSSPIDEPLSIVNVVDSRNPQGRGRGYSNSFMPPRYCTFCGKNNHAIDFRYKKHVHPNFQRQGSYVNVSSSTNEVEAQSGSSTDASSFLSSNISQEKYDKLVSLLQQFDSCSFFIFQC